MTPFQRLGTPRATFEQQPDRFLARVIPIRLLVLSDTPTVIASATDGFDLLLQRMFAANLKNAAAAVSLWLAPAATASTDAVCIAKGYAMAANAALPLPMLSDMLIEPGYTLRAACGASDDVTIHGWAVQRLGGDS
jgi:hypothetical protein